MEGFSYELSVITCLHRGEKITHEKSDVAIDEKSKLSQSGCGVHN